MKITETYESLPKIVKVLLQLFLGGIIGGVWKPTKALAENNPLDFSTSIRAVTPYEGAVLNFNTYEINAWWNSEGVDMEYLNGLFEYTDGHQEFLTCVNKTDAEHP